MCILLARTICSLHQHSELLTSFHNEFWDFFDEVNVDHVQLFMARVYPDDSGLFHKMTH